MYGGQVDVLPTLLHSPGVDTKNYIQLDQNLFSKQHSQIVTLRSGSVVAPKYTTLDPSVYNIGTDTLITEPTEGVKEEIADLKAKATKQLETSNRIVSGDLLRFHINSGLKPANPEDYDYKDQLQQLEAIKKERGKKSTSAYSKNNNKSTADEYHTDSYQDYQKVGK